MILERASTTHFGQREAVCRGPPNGGLLFSHDLSIGFSDQSGVNAGLGATFWLNFWKLFQATAATFVMPYSRYLIGLCIDLKLLIISLFLRHSVHWSEKSTWTHPYQPTQSIAYEISTLDSQENNSNGLNWELYGNMEG